jgi:transposase
VGEVRTLAADGVSRREIARRLGINRRTVARLLARDGPPRYRRGPTGSQLDPLERVMRRLLEEWPQIKAPRLTEILRCDYGYTGSLRLVQARLRELRPSPVRPAQRTGYRRDRCCSSTGRRCRRGRRSQAVSDGSTH